VRSKIPTVWTAGVGNTRNMVVPLRRSLRLKHSLSTFANSLAEELGLPDWKLQANPDLSGGRVTILVGPFLGIADCLKSLVEKLEDGGNSPVDSLICAPYTSDHSAVTRQLIDIVCSCGYDIWDGTDAEARRSFASDTRQVRLVTYESCRGLEGWNVFCCQLDKLYDQKYRDAESPQDLLVQSDMLYSSEEVAARYAASWVMIPMTRAIDHLVLHVEDGAHPLALALIAASKLLGSDSGVSVIFGIEKGEELEYKLGQQTGKSGTGLLPS